MAKISVIVPCYNVEKYLSECLGSLVGQTFSDIEIICVDDCSTDGTPDILKEFAKKDTRVKAIFNEKNQGVSESRNRAMQLVKSDYIMFCDSDDFYKPTMCEKMYEAIIKNDSDVAICSIELKYEIAEKGLQEDYFEIKEDKTVSAESVDISNIIVCPVNKIYKTEIIKGHKLSFPTGLRHEDEFFSNAYLLWVKTITFVKDRLYVYRRHSSSFMNQVFKKQTDSLLDIFKITVLYQNYLEKVGLWEEKYDWFWTSFYTFRFKSSFYRVKGLKQEKELLRLASDFIKEKYTRKVSNIYLNRMLDLTMTNKFADKKYLFGIFRYVQNPEKTDLVFCYISVFKIKYYANKKKIYILGIPVKEVKAK